MVIFDVDAARRCVGEVAALAATVDMPAEKRARFNKLLTEVQGGVGELQAAVREERPCKIIPLTLLLTSLCRKVRAYIGVT